MYEMCIVSTKFLLCSNKLKCSLKKMKEFLIYLDIFLNDGFCYIFLIAIDTFRIGDAAYVNLFVA